MKNIISYIVLISLLVSCGKKSTGNMAVNGTIDGLKKGTVFLKKMSDTLLVSVDSVELKGQSNFILYDEIDSPEVYYLTLDKLADESISFFGEKGEITITSKLSKFSFSAKITGSKNQELLDKHKAMLQQFNGRQLELIKEKFDASKENDSARLSGIEKEENNLIRRKYLYTTNFAVNNAEFEVAPYLALTDLYYANIKLLDTVNNSLSKQIKKSKYGKELDKFIRDIKRTE